MKSGFKTIFLSVFFLISFSAGAIETSTVLLDSNKPFFLKLTVSNIGPKLQCYYGATDKNSVFGVILDVNSQDMLSGSESTHTFEIKIDDLNKLDKFEFTSRIDCWVLPTETEGVIASEGQIAIGLSQQKDGPILFADKFIGFTQRLQPSDLWENNSRQIIKRVRFQIMK